jgi:hypothetical protein
MGDKGARTRALIHSHCLVLGGSQETHIRAIVKFFLEGRGCSQIECQH